jgi:geranylgeranyl pyrophosphate synthase
MFYKHHLKHLGVKYSFPKLLSEKDFSEWVRETKAPDDDVLEALRAVDLGKRYGAMNALMEERTKNINALFLEEVLEFFENESGGKEDAKYFSDFLQAHFSREKHVRVLIVQMVGEMLLGAQGTPDGLKDDLKVRKIINSEQAEIWRTTLDYLSLAVEVVDAASYVADDAFDKTLSRFGVDTPYKVHGDFAGPIGADILLHSLGNYIFYKTIREHERGVEAGYLTESGSVSTNDNPYSLKWKDDTTGVYVYINPEQYMDVWEVWSWAWYLINSGQIRDLYEFGLEDIGSFDVDSYISRAYRLSGGLIECATHLSAAFMGCGYWEGRQHIGKWAAIYGTMTQIRNDFYDYVLYSVDGPKKHDFVKETHEDVSLGRVTLPLGFAYAQADDADRKAMLELASSMKEKKAQGMEIPEQDRLKLNGLIAKNGGFLASKKIIYNMVTWAVDELMSLRKDFQDNGRYWDLVAWTVASLNILNIDPERTDPGAGSVGNMFDMKAMADYLNQAAVSNK